jgi:hypothetical protein
MNCSSNINKKIKTTNIMAEIIENTTEKIPSNGKVNAGLTLG